MNAPKRSSARLRAKVPTGIAGLDEITGGGLPRGSTTLVEGGTGSGKTVLALKSLVFAAQEYGEPGIFVAFEESPERIVANAATFGWDIPGLQRKNLFFLLDAQVPPDQVQSGSFDLGGMLATLGEKIREMGALHVVFDALDIVFSVLDDAPAERREVVRLHNWLQSLGITSIITSKIGHADENSTSQRPPGFLQFMVDCSLVLNHHIVQGISQRSLRIIKYRGSGFEENDAPFAIGMRGLEVAGTLSQGRNHAAVTATRVSTGVKRLDTMLGGGFYRGATVLLTGVPGTAKTTLAGSFVEAACARGETSLFVSFDSDVFELIRNLTSVNIKLERFVKKGLLRIASARAITGSAEIHLLKIKSIAREINARCVVIDPISAISRTGNQGTGHSVAERLFDWAKTEGITLLCTSLLDDLAMRGEATPIQISTIADTWIHLNYLIHGGERNRGLSIIKSRGTAHSNQVRELVLSSSGVTLADAYSAGGEVLMGTQRWEKEASERKEYEGIAMAAQRNLLRLDAEEAAMAARILALKSEQDALQRERKMLGQLDAKRVRDQSKLQMGRRELRGGDGKSP
jgi:circadian clock protein KaiC